MYLMLTVGDKLDFVAPRITRIHDPDFVFSIGIEFAIVCCQRRIEQRFGPALPCHGRPAAKVVGIAESG